MFRSKHEEPETVEGAPTSRASGRAPMPPAELTALRCRSDSTMRDRRPAANSSSLANAGCDMRTKGLDWLL